MADDDPARLRDPLPDPTRPLTFGNFAKLLSGLELTKADIRTLFDIMDGNGRGQVSLVQFMRGLAMFTPSFELEALRLKCLRLYGSIGAAFSKYSREFQEEVLPTAKLNKILADLRLCEDE